MKFIISDNIKLPNSFGKWNYWHDSDVKVHEGKDTITLYHGYAIDENRTMDDYVQEGELPKDLNGNFSIVKLSKKSVVATVDHFSQNRIYYWNNDKGFSLTNRLYLFPFQHKDVILSKITRYQDISKEKEPHYTWYDFEKVFKSRGGYEQQPLPKDVNERNFVHYSMDTSTCWKDTHSLLAGAILHYDDELHIKKNTNHDSLIKDAFNSKDKKFKTPEQLRDHVHYCMESHAKIINANYKTVVCSVSEGIDSQTYDAYFPNARKITHTIQGYGDEQFCGAGIETSADPRYKQEYLSKYPKGMVREDPFSVEDAGNIAEKWLNDTELKHWDCLPTYHQIMENDRDMDIFIFGQQADEMFMHNAVFYLTYVKGILRDSGIPVEQQFEKYKEYVEQLRGKYSAKEVLFGENFWEYREDYKIDSLENFKRADADFENWQDWFSYECMPTYYNREISHVCDKPVTSLYADTRMFYDVRNSTHDIMLANMSDAMTQKQNLMDKFNHEFKTPYKNGTYFNTTPMVNSFAEKTLGYCLQDHLAEINKDQLTETTWGRIK